MSPYANKEDGATPVTRYCVILFMNSYLSIYTCNTKLRSVVIGLLSSPQNHTSCKSSAGLKRRRRFRKILHPFVEHPRLRTRRFPFITSSPFWSSGMLDNYPCIPDLKRFPFFLIRILTNLGRAFAGILLELTTEEENIPVAQSIRHFGHIHAGMHQQMFRPFNTHADNIRLHR